MKGVWAFLWLSFVMIATISVLTLIYWVVQHVIGFVVDSTP